MTSAIQIRKATEQDAEAVVRLFETIYGETDYMLRERGEATQSAESLAQRIDAAIVTNAETWFVCESGAELTGVVYGRRGATRRNRHSLYLVMGVLQASWGKGIGFALLRAIERWAIENGIHRLELSVSSVNERAVSLYAKAGFEREGLKRHALCVNGHYVDELCMAKLIVS